MGALPHALEILFKVQRKRNNEKIARKKKLSNSQNVFFSFWTPPTFKASNFLSSKTPNKFPI